MPASETPFCSLSFSLIFGEAYHFHWVQISTLFSFAHALSPGGKAQILCKAVQARNCSILLISPTYLPDPDLSLV